MDKKVTDNEIIKALECCGAKNGCDNCPLFAKDSCFVVSEKEILDLINRKDAEIERLTAMVEAAEDYLNPLPFKNAYDEAIDKAKSEAIKEFAERLKEKADKYGLKYWTTVEDIDNLVKEMTNDFKE